MREKLVIVMLMACMSCLAQKNKQNVSLPADEVTVVDHIVQEGETFITIFESYGQKFVLKEYNKYNHGALLRVGSVLHVPVHTTDPSYLTKSEYKRVLAKYATSTVSATAPENAQAMAAVTKLNLKPFNNKEFKMFAEVKGEVKWMSQMLVGYRYVYYDQTRQNELHIQGYTLKIKKDNSTLSQTDDVPFTELPHKDGENHYSVKVEIYNPQDNNRVLATSDFVDFSLKWEGNKVSSTQQTTAGRVLGFLNQLTSAAETVTASAKPTTTTTATPQPTTAQPVAIQENAPVMAGETVAQVPGVEMEYGYEGRYDAELDYALTHTKSAEANAIMVRMIEITRHGKDFKKGMEALNAEYKKKEDALRDKYLSGKPVNIPQTTPATRVTRTSTRNVPRTRKPVAKDPEKAAFDAFCKEKDVLLEWYVKEKDKLMNMDGPQEDIDKQLDRYHELTGVPQVGRQHRECTFCHGDGICSLCHGGGASGRTQYGGTKESCRYCYGSGKCHKCKGSGQVSYFNHWPDEERARAMLLSGKKVSGTPQPKTTYTDKEVTCGYCRGNGKCSTCSGKGVQNLGRTDEHICVTCRGKNGARCTYCNGKGTITRKSAK